MNLFHIIIKDVKNILYDVKSLAILVIMPVVIMSILGFSLKGIFSDESGSGIDTIQIAVVKEYDAIAEKEAFIEDFSDSSMVSIEDDLLEDTNLEKIFFDQFMENEDLKEVVQYQLVEPEEIAGLMESDEIAAAVYLPEGFVYDGYLNFLSSGRNEMTIQVVSNPDYSFSSQIVVSIIEGFTENLNIQKARTGALIGDLIAKGLGSHIGDVMDNMPDMAVENAEVAIDYQSANHQESITSFQYYAAAIMSMFLMYAASFGGKAVLSEKREYTLARMAVTGTSIYKVVFSNFVRIAMLCMFQSLFMIVFSGVVLGVHWGSLIGVALGVLLMSLIIGAFGMMLSIITLTRGTYSIANFFEFVIIQLMALVGGSFIPIEVLPEAVGNLSFLSLSGLGLKMYTNAMYDLPLSANSGTYSLVIAYTVAIFIISFVMIQVSGKKVTAC